ncbi:aspartyl aminopeptidase [Flagelloscypha sp. PMI_526]|nr:aspartyl aminopeptidase [Flagelloscypha sp. PMI_526]
MRMYPNASELVTRFLSFLNASPTQFHAVYNASARLEKAGFTKLLEKDKWDVKPGGKYFFTRNQAALIAFTLPNGWKEGTGVSIVGTHVDSPNLRIRPASRKTKAGYLQVAVETYGGGIWHSWFDRDLSIAGRVVVASESGGFESKLIKIERPLMQIPTLAIHLDRDVNSAFTFNKETEFTPILGLLEEGLNATDVPKKDAPSPASTIQNNHSPALLSLIAEEVGCAPDQINDFELALYDVQPSCLGGISNEFLLTRALSFAAVESLAETPVGSGNVNAIALFNHEEIGSVSSSGAESSLVPFLISRLSMTPEAHAQSISNSFLGHAITISPLMNRGVVIKTNANQRYASDAISTFLVRQLVSRKGGNLQEFEVRNDMACGSTIGPHLSVTGIRTIDVGVAILSMHSIHVQALVDLFTSLFEGFAEINSSLTVD